jgi:hypothetical protein
MNDTPRACYNIIYLLLFILPICFISKFGLNMNFEFKHCANFYPPTIL